MKRLTIVVKTSPEGQLGFWTGNFSFSPEYPEARLLTTSNAKEIARACAAKFPGHGVEVIRNYGMDNATAILF